MHAISYCGRLVHCDRLMSHPHVSLSGWQNDPHLVYCIVWFYHVLLRVIWHIICWFGLEVCRDAIVFKWEWFSQNWNLTFSFQMKRLFISPDHSEQCLCQVQFAYGGQTGHSQCAAGCLDSRFFPSTLLVNSNQGSPRGSSPSLLCCAVLCWLLLHRPDPLLIVRLL